MLHYVGVSPAQRRRVYMECTLAATSLNQSEPKISTDCTCASNPIRCLFSGVEISLNTSDGVDGVP